MLFWIFVILFIASIGLLAFNSDIAETFAVGLMTIGLIGILSGGIVMGVMHMGKSADVAKLHTRYDTLMFQYWNDIYENDNDLGKRDLYKDIQEWNEKIVWGREAQNDFWIGIFIPDIYDQFELIELEVSYG